MGWLIFVVCLSYTLNRFSNMIQEIEWKEKVQAWTAGVLTALGAVATFAAWPL